MQSDDADHCLLVEDLGDTTLERRLMEHPEEELTWAQQAGYLLSTLAGPLTLGAPGHTFFMSAPSTRPSSSTNGTIAARTSSRISCRRIRPAGWTG